MIIFLLTLLTTSAARTTRSYDTVENYKQRTILPVLKINFNYKNSNEHHLTTTYPIEYGDIKFSEIMFPDHGSDVNQRVDSQYNYLNPYENRNEQWNLLTTTQATQFNDRFGANNDQKAFDYVKEKTTHKPETINNFNTYVRCDKPLNGSQGEKTQLNIVKINEQNNITTEYVQRNFSTSKVLSTRKPNRIPSIVKNNSGIDQSSIKPYHSVNNNKTIDNSTKSNAFTTKPYNSFPTKTNGVYGTNGTYGTKTTENNEVTISSIDSNEDDRWIWSIDKVETTTLMTLNDRAAFEGNVCPTGTVKISGRCIPED